MSCGRPECRCGEGAPGGTVLEIGSVPDHTCRHEHGDTHACCHETSDDGHGAAVERAGDVRARADG